MELLDTVKRCEAFVSNVSDVSNVADVCETVRRERTWLYEKEASRLYRENTMQRGKKQARVGMGT